MESMRTPESGCYNQGNLIKIRIERCCKQPLGSVCQLIANMAFKWCCCEQTWKDAPRGNRTRVKGVEDPHSTTELAARRGYVRQQRLCNKSDLL